MRADDGRTDDGDPATTCDHEWQARRREPATCVRCGAVWPAAALTALAIEYHKSMDGEGEYGCPGASCPGVQRLVKFAAKVAALTRPAVPSETAEWPLKQFQPADCAGGCVVATHCDHAGRCLKECTPADLAPPSVSVERLKALLNEAVTVHQYERQLAALIAQAEQEGQ
jgi:hypothetical protein